MNQADVRALPDVVLIRIFSYLHFSDLCRVSQVCQRWYQLTHSRALRKIVDTRNDSLTTHQLEKMVQNLTPAVSHLCVCGVTMNHMPFLTPRILQDVKAKCPYLQTLVIESAFIARYIHCTEIRIEDLPDQLKLLSLRRCFFHADQFFYLCHCYPPPPIQCLDLGYCWCLANHDMLFLTKLTTLKELYLECCNYIGDSGLTMLVRTVTSLTVLDIEGTNISDEALAILAKHCKKLVKLYVGRTAIADTSFSQITPSFFPALEVLCLKETKLTDSGLKTIGQTFKNLKWLNIVATTVTESKAKEAITQFASCSIVYDEPRTKLSLPPKVCEHFRQRYQYCI